MKPIFAVAVLATLSLAACNRPTGTAPQGSETAAAMPDTSQPRDPNATMTVPDAGATGAVPADGSAPAMGTATASETPATEPVVPAPKN